MKATMAVSSRTTCRAGFKCYCCQTAPGKKRVSERRALKRRSKQQFKQALRKGDY
jgi:hypothetical protein